MNTTIPRAARGRRGTGPRTRRSRCRRGAELAHRRLRWTYPDAPLSSHTGGADFSVFMGALFGAGVYWALARRSVPAEARSSELAELA